MCCYLLLQTCHLTIASYGWTANDLIYTWKVGANNRIRRYCCPSKCCVLRFSFLAKIHPWALYRIWIINILCEESNFHMDNLFWSWGNFDKIGKLWQSLNIQKYLMEHQDRVGRKQQNFAPNSLILCLLIIGILWKIDIPLKVHKKCTLLILNSRSHILRNTKFLCTRWADMHWEFLSIYIPF